MSQDLFVESQYGGTVPHLSEPWLKYFRCEQPKSTLSYSFNKNGSQCSPPSIRQLEHLPAIINVGCGSKKKFPSHELRTSDGVELVFGRFCQLILAYRDEESTSKQNDLFADIHCLFGMLEYIGRMDLSEDVALTYQRELTRMFRKCFSLPKDVYRIEDNQQAHITIFQWKLAVSCKWLADSRNDVMLCVTYGLIHILNRTKVMISCSCLQELLVSMFSESIGFFLEKLPTLVEECSRNKHVSLSDGTALGALSALDILRFFVEAVQHLASKMSGSIPIPWCALIFSLCDKLISNHFADVCTILMNFLRNPKCSNLEKCRSNLTSLLLKFIRHLESNPVQEIERMIDNPKQWALEIRDQFEFQSFHCQDSFSLLHLLMKQDDVWSSVRNSVSNQFSAAKLNSFRNNFGTMFSILFLLSDDQWFASQLRTFIEDAVDSSKKIKSLLPAVEAFAHLMEKRCINSDVSKAVIARALNRLPLPSDGQKLIEKAALFKCFDRLDMNTVCEKLANKDMSSLLVILTNSKTSLDSSDLWIRATKMLHDRIAIDRVVGFIGFKLQVDCGQGNTKHFINFLTSVFDISKVGLRTADIVLPILTRVLENPVRLSSLIMSKCIGLWIYSICAFSHSHEDNVNTLSTCMWGLLNSALMESDPAISVNMTSFPTTECNIIHFFEVLQSSRNTAHVKKILGSWVTKDWAALLKPLISGTENVSNTRSQMLAIDLSCQMLIKLGPILFDVTDESSSAPRFHETIFCLLYFFNANRPVDSSLARLILTLANMPKYDAYILGRIKGYLQKFPMENVHLLKGLNETKYYEKIKEDQKLTGLLQRLHEY